MALTNKLTAIANAIRAKTGKGGQLSLDDMVTEIGSISGGSEPVIESKNITENGTYTAPEGVDGYSPIVVNANIPPVINFSGNIKLLFNGRNGDSFLEKNLEWLKKQNITTSNIINLSNTFDSFWGDLDWLVLDCNDGCNCSAMLGNQFNGKPPIFSKVFTPSTFNPFGNNGYLKKVPDDWVEKVNLTSSTNTTGLFHSVKAMRQFPQSWVSFEYLKATSNFDECYSVDNIEDVYPDRNTLTSNQMGIGYRCYHVKKITFKTNNGQPYVRNWKNQQIKLQDRTGYFNSSSPGYGFAADKRLDNDYENLKNDPDAWALNPQYSRYDHDSAVETINSLPDTSAYLAEQGGTNTISFKGIAGSSTDAGAINTLTAAEIAVATDKGWTVTLT